MFDSLKASSFGPVQVLIANHGYYPPADVPVAEMSLAQWESTFTANMTSTFLVVREYLKQLAHATDAQKEKASIVIIGSTAGKYGEIAHADYSAAKSGARASFSDVLSEPNRVPVRYLYSHDVRIRDDVEE